MSQTSFPKIMRGAVCALILFGVLPTFASPVHVGIPELRKELQEISRQLDVLDSPSDSSSAEERAARHLALLNQHLQTIRVAYCGECKDRPFIEPSYLSVAAFCPKPHSVTTSLTLQEYVVVMRYEVQNMRDHLGRISREASPFKRQLMMPWYYRHVVDTLDRAKPRCASPNL